jgi:hypothetical protein
MAIPPFASPGTPTITFPESGSQVTGCTFAFSVDGPNGDYCVRVKDAGGTVRGSTPVQINDDGGSVAGQITYTGPAGSALAVTIEVCPQGHAADCNQNLQNCNSIAVTLACIPVA